MASFQYMPLLSYTCNTLCPIDTSLVIKEAWELFAKQPRAQFGSFISLGWRLLRKIHVKFHVS